MSHPMAFTSQDTMLTIASQAIRIRELEDRNAQLLARLEALANQSRRSDHQDNSIIRDPSSNRAGHATPTPGNTVSAEQFQSLSRKYADLNAKHNQLESTHAKTALQNEDLRNKYRLAKERVKAWKEYIERHQLNENTATEADGSTADPNTTEQQSELPSHDPNRTPRATPAVHGAAQAAHPLWRAQVTAPEPLNELSSTPKASPRGPQVTSSQTTVVESDDETQVPPTIKQEETGFDDVPVFVSARSLKRKSGAASDAGPPAQRIKKEANSPSTPIELKSQEFSSPRPTYDSDSDWSDLGQVRPRPPTPRRRVPRFNNNNGARGVSLEPPRPPMLTRSPSSLSEGNEPHHVTGRPSALVVRELEKQNHSDRHGEVLQPISSNIPNSSRLGHQSTAANSKAKQTRSKGRTALAMVSEAGDGNSSQVNQPRSQALDQEDRSRSTRSGDNRLNDALNGLLHETTPTVTRRAPSLTKNVMRKANSPHMPTPESANKPPSPVSAAHNKPIAQNLPSPAVSTKRPSPAKRRSPQKRLPQQIGSAAPVRPDEQCLRTRDPSTLRLGDFKINPRYMGTTFAFADTLRGRDARRNLHTCTRADCCGGAMKKAVELGGTAVSGKTDAEALEAYLGPEWSVHMGAFGAEKRKEIVQQAHVFCFANQHGKHKQAFQRRSTPPGFWNTDFPSTQESEQNREKARQMEREAVEERWREALRGGRWMFKDE